MIDLDTLQSSLENATTTSPLKHFNMSRMRVLVEQSGLQAIESALASQQHNIGHPSTPILIDKNLLDYNTLWLETGKLEQMLEIERDDFCSMIKSPNIVDITTRVTTSSFDDATTSATASTPVDRFTEKRIKQRLEDTLELPLLPETANRIIKLRADPNADISDLTEIVALDPSLSAQVVSWAASPYYSAPGKIKSVHDAIVRVLGFDMVLNLSLGLALGKNMSTNIMQSDQIRDYWRYAVAVAATTEALIAKIPKEHSPSFGMSYLSGLLCNIGHLIVAEVFPPYYDNISRHLRANPHIQAHAIETKIVGVDSDEIASWLLETWNMPEEVVITLKHQHNPDYQGEHSEYANLLYVAKQLLARKGITQRAAMPIPNRLFEQLHLDPAVAEATVEQVLESSEELNSTSPAT